MYNMCASLPFMALIQNGFHSENNHLVSYKQDPLKVSTEKHTGHHAM